MSCHDEDKKKGDLALDTIAADVRHGMELPLKEIPPKYFYDERGSELFEAITRTPEYYPTRSERAILEADSDAIVEAAGGPATLIELGSGSGATAQALTEAGHRVLGIDASRAMVELARSEMAPAAGIDPERATHRRGETQRTPDPEIDATGMQRFQRPKLLCDHEWSMIGQHHAPSAHAEHPSSRIEVASAGTCACTSGRSVS